jgi:hypothetical protein
MAAKGEGQVMFKITKTKTGPYGNLRDKGCKNGKPTLQKMCWEYINNN